MKLKIVNKKKFIRSLVLVVSLLILILFGITNAYSKTEIIYKEDYIIKGDTLWSIAKNEINTNAYYKNRDIRDVMFEIREINHLQDGNLTIGQKIIIPCL